MRNSRTPGVRFERGSPLIQGSYWKAISGPPSETSCSSQIGDATWGPRVSSKLAKLSLGFNCRSYHLRLPFLLNPGSSRWLVLTRSESPAARYRSGLSCSGISVEAQIGSLSK